MFPIYCSACGEQIASTASEEVAKLTKDSLICQECEAIPNEPVEEIEEEEIEEEIEEGETE